MCVCVSVLSAEEEVVEEVVVVEVVMDATEIVYTVAIVMIVIAIAMCRNYWTQIGVVSLSVGCVPVFCRSCTNSFPCGCTGFLCGRGGDRPPKEGFRSPAWHPTRRGAAHGGR